MFNYKFRSRTNKYIEELKETEYRKDSIICNLPEPLIERLNKTAKTNSISRNELITAILESHMDLLDN